MTYHTKNIRNVVLLGHSGAGKTTLSEAMLFESNALKRRGTIEGQNTTSDHTNIEKERSNSIFSTLMNVNQKILAKASLAELYKYSSSLRSLSQGRAKFTQLFSDFQSVGSTIQKQLQKHYTETNEI